MRRLLVCQGSVQCVTMLIATEAYSGIGHDDTVLIYGLSVDPGQSKSWSDVVGRLAAREPGACRTVFMDARTVRSITRWTWRSGIRTIHERLGDKVDQLFLQGNNDPMSRLCGAAYPQAERICTGDGIGVNYTESYWWARGYHPVTLALGLKRWLHSTFAAPPSIRDYATYCLLLPNLFDHRAPQVLQLCPDRFQNWFSNIAQVLEYRPAWQVGDDLDVLLLSCFSEARRIRACDEVAAYTDFVRTRWGGGPHLILKPHPRDRPEKLAALAQALGGLYNKITVLNSPELWFLPFESFYTRYLSRKAGQTRIGSFSSACLALEHLYGAACDIGFGDDLVRRYFGRHYASRRIEQERDLHRAIRTIRTARCDSRSS